LILLKCFSVLFFCLSGSSLALFPVSSSYVFYPATRRYPAYNAKEQGKVHLFQRAAFYFTHHYPAAG
ncbi:MAG: hypothetical protein VB020_05840, partial [Methanocorpusculum sp.]|nr:hypothetical protein [Methanocorpusculum sp.]